MSSTVASTVFPQNDGKAFCLSERQRTIIYKKISRMLLRPQEESAHLETLGFRARQTELVFGHPSIAH